MAVAVISVHPMMLVLLMAVVRRHSLTSKAVAAAGQASPVLPVYMVMVMKGAAVRWLCLTSPVVAVIPMSLLGKMMVEVGRPSLIGPVGADIPV